MLFAIYLKFINTFLKKNVCILKQIFKEIKKQNKTKHDIGILIGQAVFKLWIKQSHFFFFLINNSKTAWPT